MGVFSKTDFQRRPPEDLISFSVTEIDTVAKTIKVSSYSGPDVFPREWNYCIVLDNNSFYSGMTPTGPLIEEYIVDQNIRRIYRTDGSTISGFVFKLDDVSGITVGETTIIPLMLGVNIDTRFDGSIGFDPDTGLKTAPVINNTGDILFRIKPSYIVDITQEAQMAPVGPPVNYNIGEIITGSGGATGIVLEWDPIAVPLPLLKVSITTAPFPPGTLLLSKPPFPDTVTGMASGATWSIVDFI